MWYKVAGQFATARPFKPNGVRNRMALPGRPSQVPTGKRHYRTSRMLPGLIWPRVLHFHQAESKTPQRQNTKVQDMPHQTEPSANNTLGQLLRKMMRGSQILSENTQTFPDYPGRHADVLVMAPGRSPVPIEAEFLPAPEAEKDASARLGLRVANEPRAIEAAIAVRYPGAVQDCYNLEETIGESQLTYAVLYEDGTRFPKAGWLEGGVADLADLVRLVSVPQKEVEAAADNLQQGIETAATVLDELDKTSPGIPQSLARTLGMANVPQTRRMEWRDHRQRADIPRTHRGDVQGDKAAEPGVRAGGAEPAERHPGVMGGHPENQLLADLRHCAGLAGAAPVGERGGDSVHAAGDGPTGGHRGSNQRPRPNRADFPEADRGPEVLGHVLHAAVVSGAAGAPSGGQDGGGGLVGRRSNREAADWGLRVRDGGAAVGGVRTDRGTARAFGGRPGGTAPGDDGRGAVRVRRDAVGGPHNQRDAVGGAARGGFWKVPGLHDALRAAEGRVR